MKNILIFLYTAMYRIVFINVLICCFLFVPVHIHAMLEKNTNDSAFDTKTKNRLNSDEKSFRGGIGYVLDYNSDEDNNIGIQDNDSGREESSPYSLCSLLSPSYYLEHGGTWLGKSVCKGISLVHCVLAADQWFSKEDQVNPHWRGLLRGLAMSASKEVVEECAGQIILYGAKGSYLGVSKAVELWTGASPKGRVQLSVLSILSGGAIWKGLQLAHVGISADNNRRLRAVNSRVDDLHKDLYSGLESAKRDRQEKHDSTFDALTSLKDDLQNTKNILSDLSNKSEEGFADVKANLSDAKKTLEIHINTFNEKVQRIVGKANDNQTKKFVEQMQKDKEEILDAIELVDNKCLSEEEKKQFIQQINNFGLMLDRLASIEKEVKQISNQLSVQSEKYNLWQNNTNDTLGHIQNDVSDMKKAQLSSLQEYENKQKKDEEREQKNRELLNQQKEGLRKRYDAFNAFLLARHKQEKQDEKEEQPNIEGWLTFPEESTFNLVDNDIFQNQLQNACYELQRAETEVREKTINEILESVQKVDGKINNLDEKMSNIFNGSDLNTLNNFKTALLKDVEKRLVETEKKIDNIEQEQAKQVEAIKNQGLTLDTLVVENNELKQLLENMQKQVEQMSKQLTENEKNRKRDVEDNKQRQELFVAQTDMNQKQLMDAIYSVRGEVVDSNRRIEASKNSDRVNKGSSAANNNGWSKAQGIVMVSYNNNVNPLFVGVLASMGGEAKSVFNNSDYQQEDSRKEED